MILINVSNASIIPITISYKVCKYYNQYYYKDPLKYIHYCSINDSRLLEGLPFSRRRDDGPQNVKYYYSY